MAVLALGVLVLGLLPGLGLLIVDRPVRLFLADRGGAAPVALLAAGRLLVPLASVGLALVLVLLALAAIRLWLLRGSPAPRRHVTWGCGYVGATPRMQYTGTSFSAQFATTFSTVLRHLRRERLPEGPFPERGSHLETHCVDAVEERMFEVMGEGDGMIVRLARRIPVEPRFSLAAGLVVLLVVVSLVLSGSGAGR
jgi:hydrogenase-4 component B